MGSKLSHEEVLIVPRLADTNLVDFSIINPVNPSKVEYSEGETIEIRIPDRDLTLNYVVRNAN